MGTSAGHLCGVGGVNAEKVLWKRGGGLTLSPHPLRPPPLADSTAVLCSLVVNSAHAAVTGKGRPAADSAGGRTRAAGQRHGRDLVAAKAPVGGSVSGIAGYIAGGGGAAAVAAASGGGWRRWSQPSWCRRPWPTLTCHGVQEWRRCGGGRGLGAAAPVAGRLLLGSCAGWAALCWKKKRTSVVAELFR